MQDSEVRFVIRRPDDDTAEIAVEFGESGGEDITTATHDEHGRAGMELVVDTVRSIGEALGIEVVDR
jgi:hypothetical protein